MLITVLCICSVFLSVLGRSFENTSSGVSFFLVFDDQLDNSTDYSKYNFVWGASESLVSAIHTKNPKALVAKYMSWNRDPERRSYFYWRFNHPDWLVYKCDRITPAVYDGELNMPIDVSNPEVIEWQFNRFVVPASTAAYDAMAIDNFDLNNQVGACGIWRDGTWIQKYTGELHDPAFTNDAQEWLLAFRNYLQSMSDPLLLGVNFSMEEGQPFTSPEVAMVVDNVDYILDEKGFTKWGEGFPDENAWLNTHGLIELLQQRGKAYFSINELESVSRENKEWAIASYLMSNHNLSYVVAVGIQQYGIETFLPEYTELNIGHPMSTKMKLQDMYLIPPTLLVFLFSTQPPFYSMPFPLCSLLSPLLSPLLTFVLILTFNFQFRTIDPQRFRLDSNEHSFSRFSFYCLTLRIYIRMYSNGIAFANPNNNSNTVTVTGADYIDATGTNYPAGTEIFLKPHTGKVLAISAAAQARTSSRFVPGNLYLNL